MWRWFEFIVALMLTILCSPIILVVSLLIWIDMGRPILFTQLRPGLFAKPFVIYKFRTMQPGNGTDDARVTTLGKWLRKFSLDELPQLINILKGDITFIGPRPLLMEFLPLYSPEQSRRHNVKPGITGWAQVNGRNSLSMQDKFKLDVWYVDNKSLWLNLKILVLTPIKVLQAQDIAYTQHGSVDEFLKQKTSN